MLIDVLLFRRSAFFQIKVFVFYLKVFRSIWTSSLIVYQLGGFRIKGLEIGTVFT